MANNSQSFAESSVVIGRDLGDCSTHEGEVTIAHLNIIAWVEAGGAAELSAIDKRAVFRRDIVEFALVTGVNQNCTMPAGNVGSLYNNVIIRQPADRVDADLERVNRSFIDQPMIRGGRRLIDRFLNHRMGACFRRRKGLLFAGKC